MALRCRERAPSTTSNSGCRAGQFPTADDTPTWLSLAAARSDGQGWPKAIAKRLALDGHEHGGRLRWSGELCCSECNDDNSEGSSPSGAKIARILVFGRSVRIGTMMQSCASRRSSEAAGPFFIAARKPWRSVGSPPPRIVIGSPASMDRQCGCQCCSVVPRFACPSLTPPDAR